MSGKTSERSTRAEKIWAAAGAVLAAADDPKASDAWRRAENLRRSAPDLTVRRLRETLIRQGLSGDPAAADKNALTAAVQLVQICAPQRGAAQDLDDVLMIYAIAAQNPDLKSVFSAERPAAIEAEGSERMNEAIDRHVAAFRDAELDEARFKAALKALFADNALTATDRKKVAAAVTRSPAGLLSSDRNRRDELERWFYELRSRARRAQERAVETSRF